MSQSKNLCTSTAFDRYSGLARSVDCLLSMGKIGSARSAVSEGSMTVYDLVNSKPHYRHLINVLMDKVKLHSKNIVDALMSGSDTLPKYDPELLKHREAA
ncbi:hypothetical protein CMI45_03500 [Candidatus Pacearchaeota archaeon]|nr:hypothetical protein [Candidatus Pacearchaeota archaeon]|tara:strand:+ start:419 stop:718 length:300 start_codon:yes stop_codon:yes gene_type:complete